jgi:hypothetical protein
MKHILRFIFAQFFFHFKNKLTIIINLSLLLHSAHTTTIIVWRLFIVKGARGGQRRFRSRL